MQFAFYFLTAAYFLMQFVISKWTSCLSSNSNMAPKYPILLSVNFCDAISFRHSSYKSKKHFVTLNFLDQHPEAKVQCFLFFLKKTHFIYLPEMCRITQHVHVQQLCHISAAISVVFFSEGRSDRCAFFLDHLSLLGLGPSRPDGPDQLPQSDRSWHPLQFKKRKIQPFHEDHRSEGRVTVN